MLEVIDKQTNIEFIKKILDKYSSKEILSEIIRNYFTEKKIPIESLKNSLINELLGYSNLDIRNYIEENELHFSLKNIEEFLYASLSENSKKENGIVYTPSLVSDFIVEETLKSVNKKSSIGDFSCGCGEFLLSALKYAKHIIPSLSLIDFIIGNPPYVKIQELSSNQKKYLQQHYMSCKSGSYNLFYAFIELSLNILSENGKIGYIVPNHLLKMKSAFGLRALLVDSRSIYKVIDFKDNQLFSNAQTYSAILFLDKSEKSHILYKNIQSNSNSVSMKKELKNKFDQIRYDDVNPESINLLDEIELLNINKIENQPFTLNISTGIATQKDKLYLIDYTKKEVNNDKEYFVKKYNDTPFLIEKEITIPIIKGSGEKKVNTNNNFYEFNRIIYPYENMNGNAVPISIVSMKEKFPNTLNYFIAIKDELSKRNAGKPTVNIWYEYGRSQALNSHVPKIIFPTNSLNPNFVYFTDYALFNNGYAIYGVKNSVESIDLDILAKILNSVIMKYYIENTSYMIGGGYFCFQKKYLKNFSIPHFEKDELTFIKNCDSKRELDLYLIEKYQLNINYEEYMNKRIVFEELY
uniref:site-specific DNA-methyltransferase (adenine-specific) n=1 Tax=Lactococcus lactis TaxID=1358 RepID=P71445_9LACT|nr:LlaBIM [Lactococcus cremoris]